jgi:hypothetical protein
VGFVSSRVALVDGVEARAADPDVAAAAINRIAAGRPRITVQDQAAVDVDTRSTSYGSLD